MSVLTELTGRIKILIWTLTSISLIQSALSLKAVFWIVTLRIPVDVQRLFERTYRGDTWSSISVKKPARSWPIPHQKKFLTASCIPLGLQFWTPWRRMGGKGYVDPGILDTTISWSGQIHAPAVLPLGKKPTVPSRDNVVGIATSYGLDDRGVGVRVPVGSRFEEFLVAFWTLYFAAFQC
jgi:hypothetical protein